MDIDGTGFGDWLDELVEAGPQGLARFSASLDPEWIETALKATGKASLRRRKLPADQAVWLVIGMGLFADRAIASVVDHLGLVIPGARSLAASAIPQARYRLGPEPIEWLFRKVAAAWSDDQGATYRGLSLHAVDGTCLRVQDSDDNFAHFGKPGGRGGTNDAGYPQARVVALLNIGTRMLEDVAIGKFGDAECDLAERLWGTVPENSLTILDRGFSRFSTWSALVDPARNKHLMVRLRATTKYVELEELPDGSMLVELTPSQPARARNPQTSPIRGRIVAYQHPEGEPVKLFVSLLDASKHPANRLVTLYHDRWEVEVAFDELKTHMLQRKEALRSRKPEGVLQEVWGLLLTYNLIRREMSLAAQEHGVEPSRISFTSAMMWIRTVWLTSWRDAPGTIPQHLGNLRTSLNMLILPERRSERRYPRHVKIKMSNYKRNRGKRSIPKENSPN